MVAHTLEGYWSAADFVRDLRQTLDAQPDLAIEVIDNVRASISATRKHRGVWVRLGSSTVEADRGGARYLVEDEVLCTLWYRIAPKDQGDAMLAAYDLADDISERLTGQMRQFQLRLRDIDRPDPVGEWMSVTHTYTALRNQSAGQG